MATSHVIQSMSLRWSPHIGIPSDIGRHGGSQYTKTHRLNHAQGVYHHRHQFYMCQIHGFSKMLLHNRKDLVNFDQVLGILSNFHQKMRSNFSFKLLNFRDFCKFNHLIIRCLITCFDIFVMN